MRIDVSNDLGDKLLAIAKKEGLEDYAHEQLPGVPKSVFRNALLAKVVRFLELRYETRVADGRVRR